MSIPAPEQSLAWWRNVALGLTAELVIRGNRIDELERQLAKQDGKCYCHCDACKFCEQLLEPEVTA